MAPLGGRQLSAANRVVSSAISGNGIAERSKNQHRSIEKDIRRSLHLDASIDVVRLGKTTAWVPSLGILVASKVGKETPPSVESSRLTLVALTGEEAVPATFQVTVRAPDQVTSVLGAVRTNGPALLVTVTCMSALFTPPPPARLSGRSLGNGAAGWWRAAFLRA